MESISLSIAAAFSGSIIRVKEAGDGRETGGGRTKGILYPAIVLNTEFGAEMFFHADTKDARRPPTRVIVCGGAKEAVISILFPRAASEKGVSSRS